jgi:hypothetical protein
MNRRLSWHTWTVAGASSAILMCTGCGDDSAPSIDGGTDAADSTTGMGLDTGVDHTTADATNDQTAVDQKGTDAASDAGADAASDSGACTLFDASGLDDASVQAGRLAVWTVYRCQGCHQKATQKVDDAGAGIVLSGNNDGLGDSGQVFPSNLTGDPMTGLGCWTDAQILNAILHGKAADGGSLCPSMPKWGNALFLADGGPRPGTPMDAGTAQAIVDFLRSLPPVNNQLMSTMCPMGATEAGSDSGDASSDAGSADAGSGEASALDAGDTGASDAADSGTE